MSDDFRITALKTLHADLFSEPEPYNVNSGIYYGATGGLMAPVNNV